MWVLGIPSVLVLVLYVILLITPVQLPFAGQAVRGFVQSLIPPTSRIEMGDMALALEGGIWPVIQFAPVEISDSLTGARVAMDALEVGFSPARALFGQPGATVTVVGPHLQLVQDLYGPRLASFELVDDPEGGTPTLRVLEGEQSFPAIDISSTGVGSKGAGGTGLRSDNDWLIYNLKATEVAVADLVEQAALGRFSRLVVREGTIDLSDSVYGLYRRIDQVALEIGPTPSRRETSGSFSANIGGRKVVGTIARHLEDDGAARLKIDVTNLDFSALMPFIDDRESLVGVQGSGSLSIDVHFASGTGTLESGDFKVDLTGLDLRIGTDYFPIATSILDVRWEPATGRFHLDPGAVQVGNSTATLAGTFALGLDDTYGPTIGMSIAASDVALQPNDMAAPEAPFESVELSGWSAPLYGAMGIDRLVARRGEMVVETAGRLDMLRAGLGVQMTIAGRNATADDVKRLWPYIMGTESRDWFVAHVSEGVVADARMRFNFPVGSLGLGGEDKPIPKDSMQIDMVGEGVAVQPLEGMTPIVIEGETRLKVDDATVTIAGGGGTLTTAAGVVTVRNPALVFDNSVPGESIAEASGDIAAPIPALLALVREQQPAAVEGLDLPVDLDALTGSIDLGLVATIGLPDADAGRETSIDYVVNGTIADFASTSPIEGRRIDKGSLAFSASQSGYQLGGTAEIDGMEADLSVEGTPTTAPVFRLASTVAVADLAAMGFDASEFLSGTVRFAAQPLDDGALGMSVDLEQAGLTISDLGLSKRVGTPGTLSAIVRPDGDLTRLESIALSFGEVRLNGSLDFSATKGLVAARFDTFALAEGDSAQVELAPMEGGYAVRIRGEQLDFKPMLSRFFSLGQGSGGVQATQIDQAIALDVQLERALGFYATTAFNLDMDLLLRGSNLSRATLSAQFSEGNAISVATNAAPNGRTMTVAFNDAGTVLRLLGIYSQLAGGSGSLVLTTDRTANAEAGRLLMRGFSIVDEDKVVQILGNHSDSRDRIARSNRLDFAAGQVDFIRRSDRVEVTDAVLTGDSVGGTMRGFIYTDRRQYDLSGTYVPLFGINSVFQRIPLLGPLLGGRDGEGLVGVTFAIRGPLENPEFRINPLSILAPGVFRELFEFRSRELPQATQ